MLDASPRYLTSFHPKRVPHFLADVLILGGGLAGLRAAMAIDPKLSTLVITKGELNQSNSSQAQGGIAGVIDENDRFEDHTSDTLSAGGVLCERDIVDMVIQEAPQRIDELIDWGTQFDSEDGRLALGREGGHSAHRIVHALGDATGREVMRAVVERAETLPNVQLWPHTFTIDLLTSAGRCQGALVWKKDYGKTFVWAKETILCTGGIGQLWRDSTNPSLATGDGHAIAYRAGVELRDMEFMQFHPTVLYIAGSSRSLITEAMRGEGAYLIDRTGHRFMPDFDERAELAPRDVVCQAIVEQMRKTRHPNVYLDMHHLDAAYVRRRFPGMVATCAKFGLDLTRQRIPVRPGAHYMIGGVTVDRHGATTLPGLWAAGEVTSSGLHGANRLASNSLLEALVFGAHAGEGASNCARESSEGPNFHAIENPESSIDKEPLDLGDIRNSLKSLMWRSVGVSRDRTNLDEAADTVDQWRNYVLARQFDHPEGWELQNMLHSSRIVIEAARCREETRGVHVRTDFPEPDDARWSKRLCFRREST